MFLIKTLIMKPQIQHACSGTLLAIIFFVMTFFSGLNSLAQKQQHRIKFTEIHIEGLASPKNVDFNTNQYGAGASVTVGKEYVGAILECNYNKVELKNKITATKTDISFTELYMGIRYYPMRPTLIVGYTAVRLTAGAMYGLDFEPNWRGMIFGGLALSSIRNTSGVNINVVYRPGTYPTKKYMLEPSIALRIGIIIGPKG
jgi:hypothetical protein